MTTNDPARDDAPPKRRTVEFTTGSRVTLPPFESPSALAGAAPSGSRTAAREGAQREEQPREDRVGAVRFATMTLVAAAIASGVIEWEGWQILYRHAGPAVTLPAPGPLGVPTGPWLYGAANSLSAAVGVGIAVGALTLLIPAARARPWRSAAVGFALGAAALLAALGALTVWAP